MTKKEILDKLGTIRQSTIKSYQNCGINWRLRYIEGVKPSYRHPAALHGSSLHLVLFWLSGNWDMDIARMYRKAFNHYEFGDEENVPVRWAGTREETLEAFTKNAVEIIEGYRSKEYNRDALVLFAEAPFKVRIMSTNYSGMIDQVRKNPDGSIELVDFKSNKQKPNPYSLDADWQLSLYSYALRFGELKVDGIWVKPRLLATHSTWYHLRAHEKYKRRTGNAQVGDEKGNPRMRSSRSLQQLRHFRKEIANIVKVMSKDWTFPNPSSCSYCGYTQECAARAQILPDRDLNNAQKMLQELEMEVA
jgi:RecB family exonuclease